jgi:ATP-dependent RNA helicase DHX8/PRP22
MTKVMVGHFVSDTHKVMTALIHVLLPSSVVVESLQSHKMWLCVNRDILLGLLKRVAAERKPELKVIVTSATLDGQKFSEYFFNCPVVTVPGKLYPVQLLYSVDRPVNYLDSSVQTALDIHVREPPGDILLFMTGQEEILKAISMLEERVKALEEGSCLDVEILPLYASLPPESQACYYSCLGAFVKLLLLL